MGFILDLFRAANRGEGSAYGAEHEGRSDASELAFKLSVHGREPGAGYMHSQSSI
jgi:hypothetical protein